jgi:hypothetical protein
MSVAIKRAVVRLAMDGALLGRLPSGRGFGVFAQGDRRRRPVARLSATDVAELQSSGALAPLGDGFVLSDAGQALARREAAEPGEAYLAQHGEIGARTVVDADGALRTARGREPSALLRRLAQLCDAKGAPWLTDAELAAARELRSDWEAAQIGLGRGSDWSAPPIGGSARRADNGRDYAMAVRCDARRRIAAALDELAPPLRRAVERVCIVEEGLEALERAESWPARSGKLVLKLGLAQLAMRLRR